MSIRNTYPTIRPSLSLNFARSRTLDPRITFSRTTTGTYMDADGLIKVASADEARFDHSYDPVSGTVRSLGLLVEEQSTNSLLYSNDFSQNSWIKQNSHPVPTQDVIGPDGVSGSGWRFYRTSTNQYIYQSIIGAGTHTLSAWVRSEEATGDFRMSGYNATNGTMQTSFTATNEWRRFNITISPTVNTNYYPCIPTNTNKTFYVYGAQVELNKSFPTSYIPTEGSPVTRTADNVSMVGENFSSWYNQSEGTIYCSFKNTTTDFTTRKNVYSISGSSQIEIRSPNTDFNRLRFVFNGNFNSNPTQFSATLSQRKTAFSYNQIENIGYIDGVYVEPPGSHTNDNTKNILYIGKRLESSDYFCGHISKLTYYPRRLTNSQLQNLTK